MQVENITNKKIYAMKIILPIKKYIESAKLEAKLVEKTRRKRGNGWIWKISQKKKN